MANPFSLKHEPQSLSHSNNLRSRTSASDSPEFDFWAFRNPSLPPPHLLSASELFSGGVLLPLHLLNQHHSADPIHDSVPGDQPNLEVPKSQSGPPGTEPTLSAAAGPSPPIATESAATASVLAASKRWKDFFKKKLTDKSRKELEERRQKEEERKREMRSGGIGSNSAEINMNLWPFSRSKSAGNYAAGRTRKSSASVMAANRKVSSAPCSRSNSAGESKSRKWPPSPGRSGVHLGRSSPVWHARRIGSGGQSYKSSVRYAEKPTKKEAPATRRVKTTNEGALAGVTASSGCGGEKRKVLNLNVPICAGYRNHSSCSSYETSAVGTRTSGDAAEAVGKRGGGIGGGKSDGCDEGVRPVGSGGTIFNIRSFFTKKVH
ncbi:hypothetical protein Nepgr_017615 [Nepenthes gracilis]|uniref:Uncharacterized protein n=1 Tax=Nepenthes gracilis TaxID=150966 RepID=A0AAD3SRZ5_NEPGR|nr:hypothetical protein Nepgr_017615 [Nepenthes gracilis]